MRPPSFQKKAHKDTEQMCLASIAFLWLNIRSQFTLEVMTPTVCPERSSHVNEGSAHASLNFFVEVTVEWYFYAIKSGFFKEKTS